MRICVLGPIRTKDYYGGVAIFDEEIALGFLENGCEVVIATNQLEAKNIINVNNVPVFYIDKIKFNNYIYEIKPDIILASLDYAKYLLFLKTSAKKIYFLHGFFNQAYYGKLISIFAVIYQKILISSCDLVFANSYFTKMINNDFFGIKSDRVFHLGVTNNFFHEVTHEKCIKIRKTILFAGRLVSAKGIDKLIKAVEILSNKHIEYKLYIIGDGSEKHNLEKFVDEHNLSVEFLGRLEQKDLIRYYMQSDIFVSLNSSEPFGIVFVEALLSECKILCPKTGGQVEFLSDYSEGVSFIDADSPKSIADGLIRLLKSDVRPRLSLKEKEKFTYKKVANNILDFVDLKRSNM